jgi:hypothetical protein
MASFERKSAVTATTTREEVDLAQRVALPGTIRQDPDPNTVILQVFLY